MKYISVAKYTAVGISAGLLLTACASMDSDEGSYSSYDSTYDSSYSGSASVQEASGSQQSSSDWQQGQQSSQRSTSQASQGTQMEGDQWIIPLHEEQVNVGKRSVESGQVTIRKVVTTETINQPIELRRETLVIDREGSSGNIARSSSSSTSSSASASSQEFSEPSGAQRSTTTQQSSSQYQSSSQGVSSDSQPFQEQTFTIRLREEQPVVEKNVVQTGRVVARKSSETDRQNIQRQVRREDVQLDRSGTGQNVQIHGNFQGAGTQGREAAGAQRSTTIDRSSQSETDSSLQHQQGTRIEQDSTVIEGRDIQSGEDKNTLDEINRGNNTRGGAEDLQDFDEKAPK